jgi:hypothetical protein
MIVTFHCCVLCPKLHCEHWAQSRSDGRQLQAGEWILLHWVLHDCYIVLLQGAMSKVAVQLSALGIIRE